MRRRFVFSAVVCAALAVPTVLRAEGSILSNGLYVRGNVMTGQYDVDLEPRYQDDLFYGALLQGLFTPGASGIGYGLPWEYKEYGGFGLGAEYRQPSWFAGLDVYSLNSSPSYLGFALISASGATTSIFESTKLTSLERFRHTIYGGIPINIGSATSLDVFGGLRVLRVEAAYDSRILLVTGAISSLDFTLDSNSTGQGHGPTLGVALQHRFENKIEFRGSLSFFFLHGSWLMNKVNGTVTTVGAASSVGGHLIHEDGLYRIRGSELILGGTYPIQSDLNVFASLTTESSQIQDREVHRIDTNNLSSTSRLLTDFITNYPGSVQPDSVHGLVFGIEKRFDF